MDLWYQGFVKELTATFHSEVFRPIVMLVVPGFYASSSATVSLFQRFPTPRTLIDKYPGAATVVYLLIILAVGLIMEEIGARLEIHFDRRVAKCVGYERHSEEWFDYLRIAFDKEPVGHRYLRTLVLRLKFELGMTVATVPFAAGVLSLQTVWVWRLIVFVGSIVIGTYLFYEAKCSNKALSELRREMLKREW